MITKLNEHEIRVLGCLLEKEMTTPEYYPLTLNSLKAACNQKSNREPVMSMTDQATEKAVNGLIDKYYAWRKPLSESRVPKYAHRITALHDFNNAELAILTELFLRGPQTLGELRTRCQRMYEFRALEAVQVAIDHLMNDEFGPFIVKLPTQPGRRENRYMHLFGKAEIEYHEPVATAPARAASEEDRIDVLEQEVKNLREEIAWLKTQLEALRG